MLSQAKIAELFADKKTKREQRKAGKGKVFIRNEHGLVTEIITKMGDYDLGQHVGKVGTMRRSRKGASRRMPNGKRSYQPHDYDADGTEVVAYSLKK